MSDVSAEVEYTFTVEEGSREFRGDDRGVGRIFVWLYLSVDVDGERIGDRSQVTLGWPQTAVSDGEDVIRFGDYWALLRDRFYDARGGTRGLIEAAADELRDLMLDACSGIHRAETMVGQSRSVRYRDLRDTANA